MLLRLVALFAAIVVSVSCSSPRSTTASDSRLLGKFCHSSLDAAVCIQFKSDQTYEEDFASSAVGISNGPIKSGRWQQKAGEVWLFPAGDSRRVLKILEQNGALVLSEIADSKIIRTYCQ